VITREVPAMSFDLTITNSDNAFIWDPQWQASTGVPKIDLTADVRNVTLGTGAAVALKPAVQLAAVRTDRPDDGTIVTGNDITGADLKHFQHSLSGQAQKFYFRRGMAYRLTAGSFARAQGLLYMAWPCFGRVLTAEKIVFNPTNDTNVPSVFPLGGGLPIPAVGVSTAKLVVFGMGNLNNTLEVRLMGRAFNDPLARGAWIDTLDSWRQTSTPNFFFNTGDVNLTDLALASNQWFELAVALRKAQGGDANSRVDLHVVPALVYA
jgi:hypothetical protein